ncbi:MAG: hypothetical protein ACXACU_15870 [Candidatus Hodarchaeales archaeon]|jgi:hypothetical protein
MKVDKFTGLYVVYSNDIGDHSSYHVLTHPYTIRNERDFKTMLKDIEYYLLDRVQPKEGEEISITVYKLTEFANCDFKIKPNMSITYPKQKGGK